MPRHSTSFKKYGASDLVILGISVSEERQTVERFLKEHPHLLPSVSTSENEMPRAYQVGIFQPMSSPARMESWRRQWKAGLEVD